MAIRGHKTRERTAKAPRRTTRKAPAPDYFTPTQRAAWDQLVKLLIARGTLDRTDPTIVESYAVQADLLRQAQEDVRANGIKVESPHGIKTNPAVSVLNSATMRLNRLATALGLVPASSKLSARIDTEANDDPMESILGLADTGS